MPIPAFAIWFAVKRFAGAAIPAVIAFAKTWIGGVLIAGAVSGWWFSHAATKRERAACDARAEESRRVADTLDAAATNEALFNVQKQLQDMSDLKASADAENQRLKRERRARPLSPQCEPTPAERDGLRPRF